MALNFGNFQNKSKQVCFQSPSIDFGNPLDKLSSAPNFEDIKIPNFINGALDFGKKLSANLKNFELPKIDGKQFKAGIDFGGSKDLGDKIKALKVPTTICITLGGGLGLDSMFSQVGGILDSLVPKVQFQLPDIPPLDLASIIPPLFVDIRLPINLNLTQALDAIKNNCINSIMNALKGLDPLERLKQLLSIASELCAAAQFTQLKAVIDQIQQAQAELIEQAISFITDPIAKLTKLIDMAVDAIQAGAYDIVEQIAAIINGVKFDALIQFLEKLDPTIAIGALIANIRQMAQLRNFGPINQMLSAIQVIKSKLAGALELPNALLSIPEMTLDALQAEIDRLLNIEDFLGIQAVLAEVQRVKDQLINTIRSLSPAELLSSIPALLQEALQKLDMSQYSQLLQEAGSKLCEDIASLVPSLPDVPAVNPASVLPAAVL
jgi:hypothetical protein